MITLRHTTIGRNPLDERPVRRTDHYLTIYNTHKRQTSISPAGFEFTIPAREWPQTDALDRADTGISKRQFHYLRQTTTTASWLQHISAASKSLCVRQSQLVQGYVHTCTTMCLVAQELLWEVGCFLPGHRLENLHCQRKF
jgi:hypothetical protein